MTYYFIISFVLTGLFQLFYIKKLNKVRFFQRKEATESIKKICIKELHKHKAATPSFGGMAIIASLFLVSLLYMILTRTMLGGVLLLLLFGLLGFLDDYIKLKKIRDGVSPKEKLLGVIAISILLVSYLSLSHQIDGFYFILPFFDFCISMGALPYYLCLVLLLVAASNSMNITDGLDGLALGISSIVLTVIGLMAWKLQVKDVLFGAIVLEGSCLASLCFNRHPAKVFIGDTGSLLLGGAIAYFLIRLQLPLWMPFLLIVCVWEMLSVILQLGSLRFFKKRVFLIAPYHHHLEKRGWKETTIVLTFWMITLLFSIISYVAFWEGRL